MKKNKIDPVVVGERIKRIRESMQLSMEEFASRIDSNAKSGTVNNWESGKNLPNKKRLNRIAELGGITVNELLYGDLKTYLYSILSQSDKFKDTVSIIDVNHLLNIHNSGLEKYPKFDSDNYPTEEEVIQAYESFVSRKKQEYNKETLRLGRWINKTGLKIDDSKEFIDKLSIKMNEEKEITSADLKELFSKIYDSRSYNQFAESSYNNLFGLSPKKAEKEINTLDSLKNNNN